MLTNAAHSLFTLRIVSCRVFIYIYIYTIPYKVWFGRYKTSRHKKVVKVGDAGYMVYSTRLISM